MTFTKEKLQKLENAAYDTHCVIVNGGSFDNTDLDQLVQAATALPKYIAALEEAERTLESIARDYIELSHDKVRVQRDDYMRYAKEALTTIRQLAMGNAQ